MKIFIDTNIILDVLQNRTAFRESSMAIMQMAINKDINLFASPLSFATCFYILRRELGRDATLQSLRSIKSFIEMTTMDNSQVSRALSSDMPDFEDMLQFESAIASGCDVIVTGNGKHFPQEWIPILTPSEFLDQYTV